jgi:predicted nuclease with RNAse H fold
VLHRVKEEAGDEPVLSVAAWRQQQLHAAEYNEDSPSYLKTLLDSMNDHRAWEAPLSIVIEHSIRECNLFIDLCRKYCIPDSVVVLI